MQSRPEDSEAQEQCQMVAVPNMVAAKGCFAGCWEWRVSGNEHRVFCGVAGWSYPDWKDTVYRLPPQASRQMSLFEGLEPEQPKRQQHAKDCLAFISHYVDFIEVNSSFYRTPSRKTVEQWCGRAEHRSGFFFTAKLHQAFTHRFSRDPQLARQFRDAFQPLAEAGRLHGLLAQFRYDCEFAPDTMDHLKWLVAEFSSLAPLIVEVRHRSWEHPVAFDWLLSTGVVVASLDYPLAANSFRRRHAVENSAAYFRLHGRNRQAWFAKNTQPHEPYNYDYSEAEIEELRQASEGLLDQAKTLTIVANNHYRGKAVSTALRLKAALLKQKVPVPPALLQEYPALQKISAEDNVIL